MRRDGGCVLSNPGRPPRACLASWRGCLSLLYSTSPFGARFLPVEFFWCMLLRASPGRVFLPLKGASYTAWPCRWRPLARPASPSCWKGGGWFPSQAFSISCLLLSSLRREMSKKRGGLLGALCCPQIVMMRGEWSVSFLTKAAASNLPPLSSKVWETMNLSILDTAEVAPTLLLS